MKKLFFIIFIIAWIITGTASVHAADFSVSPALIDAHGLPRDIQSYQVTIVNTSGRTQNIFAVVNELTTDGKQAFTDPSISDRPASLADWIEISRGAMLFQPGESKTIPVGITINPYATAGDYHAEIAFVPGGTRADAETHLDGAPQVLINMSVASNAKEILHLSDFAAGRPFYSSFPVDIHYSVVNDGNVPSTPTGVVIFYDREGHELGSANGNPDNVAIAPGETKDFSVTWKDGPNFGQYKAVVQLIYGAQAATLANTALFWILPWQKLLIIFVVLLALIIWLAIWLHKKYEQQHYAREQAMKRFMNNRRPTSVLDLRPPQKRDE